MAIKIYVDPGHGGSDPGAIGINKIEEEDITLAVGKYLKTELERQGITVKMSRTGDTSKTVNERAKESNKWGADIFCSLHCNSYKQESANGTETLIYKKGGEAEKIAKKVQSSLVSALSTTDRGIKERPDLCVLRETNAPAILTEVAFISNKKDKSKMDEAPEQKQIAVAICKGICSYLGKAYKPEVVLYKDDKEIASWAKDAVYELKSQGIMNGDDKGNFNPTNDITRQEMAVLIDNLCDKKGYFFTTYPDNVKYKDHNDIATWAVNQVYELKKKKLMNGDDKGKFNPKNNLTRQEAAQVLYNVYGKSLSTENVKKYADDKDISAWATKAVYTLKVANIMVGNDANEFNPKDNLSRQEAAVAVTRLIDKK